MNKTFEEQVNERANEISIPEIDKMLSSLTTLRNYCVFTEKFEPHVFKETVKTEFGNSFAEYNDYAKIVRDTLLIAACNWSLLMDTIDSLTTDIKQFEAALKQSKATCLVAQELIQNLETE